MRPQPALSMKRHVDVLGLLYIVWGALSMLIGLAMGALAGAAFVIAGSQPPEGGGRLAARLVGSAFVSAAVVGLAWGGLHLWEGAGLRRPREWARAIGLVLGAINLFLFPLGTALGIYTLWVLLSDQTRSVFHPQP